MVKNSTYQQKFSMLKTWFPQIIDSVRKDLRNDHLRHDVPFCKRYFSGKNVAKLTSPELAEGYHSALNEAENSENIGDFIANRWLLKNSDLYDYFAPRLAKINPDFSEIEELSATDAKNLIDGAAEDFDIQQVYIFSVLNSVAFSEAAFADLAKKAEHASHAKKKADESAEVERSIDKLINDHQTQLARVVDKYEKKLQGLEKKYHHDTDMLKKQVSKLQKQLAG